MTTVGRVNYRVGDENPLLRQFVYDEELEQSLALKSHLPVGYFTDIVEHTNKIYDSQCFGDYKLQFYVERVTPVFL